MPHDLHVLHLDIAKEHDLEDRISLLFSGRQEKNIWDVPVKSYGFNATWDLSNFIFDRSFFSPFIKRQ